MILVQISVTQMSWWWWFWWCRHFLNRVGRQLKKSFGELKSGSIDSATRCGSRPIYKTLEALLGSPYKPLSKQLLNEDTSWDSPICSHFQRLVSRVIQALKWGAATLWFWKYPIHSARCTTPHGHLKCLYHDWFQLKAPQYNIHSTDLRFAALKLWHFPVIINNLLFIIQCKLKGKFLESDSLGF